MTEPTDQPYQHPESYAAIGYPTVRTLNSAQKLSIAELLQHVLPSLGGIAGDIKKPDVVELAYDRNPLRAMYSQTKLWKIVVEDLPQLRLPVLLFTSRTDHVIPPISWQTFLKRVGSDDVTQIFLEDSYHVATLDNDAELIFTESVRFIQRLAPQRP